MNMYEMLREADPSVYQAIELEVQRQRQNLELIASENYTSVAVMTAMGSHLTNKYAEGYPGRRYYGGCVNVDTIEDLARTRAKQLFGADHANVQPHSGAQANMRSTSRCSSRATPCWAWTWPTAATSPTATRSTARASCTSSSATT